MTPEQLLALMQLLADLRMQLGEALEENVQLRSELAERDKKESS